MPGDKKILGDPVAPLEYTLTRSRRRSIEARVKDGAVYVRCPQNMPMKDIEAFLQKKRQWIDTHLSKQLAEASAPRSYTPGGLFPLLGGEYPILFSESSGFDGSAISLRPSGPQPEQVRAALAAFYQRFAEGHIPARVNHFSPMFKADISTIRIREYRSQWGSCSAQNRLSFNTRLVLYAPEVIDYVVVHELAHTIRRDHSPAFWAVVEAVLPDYKQRRSELSRNLIY